LQPGERESCVGCHESQGMTPTSKPALASRKPPQEIKPFVGPVRGYSFVRDVQPVLDKYCVGCHDGKKPNRPNFKRGPEVFRTVKNAKGFNQSYLDLMRYVRRSGPESNQHMLSPLEFHTSTSELMQILQKGHKGVVLDKQSMDILRTWMDLNVPFHGVWTEVYDKIPWDDHKRRMWALKKYANRADDQNAINYDGGIQQYVAPAKAQTNVGKKAPKADGFPFDAAAAAKKRDAAGLPKEIVADLGDGVSMRFTLIPAGEFVMGANNRILDEGPARLAKVEKPFYMAQFETTNRQYAAFDPSHDSGHLDRHWKDHVNPGYPANRPEQSVIRVNWNQANEFCEFMSKKFGLKFSLPTETQWEWAARAGSGSDFWFGKASANYGAYENLADYNTIKFAVNGIDPQPVINPSPYIAYIPNDKDVDDGNLIMTEVGRYKPNPFGLYDINGNVSEWTADAYTKTLGGEKIGEKKAVRGGSWRDRAKWARVSVRRGYEPWQKVYNVGFRVIIEDAEKAAKLFKKAEPLPPYKDRPTTPRENSI
ncbi:MAG: SUMF1/EgtB/PvdO family nonheme iron enzyme, partial [Opitutales bacterium]|nr:SUMF1/EgtB/PvdO family nonheme iron enzyme [Opitutales bacterium]